eukprot:GHVN01079071.1.p1 GENE.GHVN01079071.1~~GHVN01079071.1.p1  ORF type:complete len:254 (+),score=39.01 GHVN01079071.1:1376-2137(+)
MSLNEDNTYFAPQLHARSPHLHAPAHLNYLDINPPPQASFSPTPPPPRSEAHHHTTGRTGRESNSRKRKNRHSSPIVVKKSGGSSDDNDIPLVDTVDENSTSVTSEYQIPNERPVDNYGEDENEPIVKSIEHQVPNEDEDHNQRINPGFEDDNDIMVPDTLDEYASVTSDNPFGGISDDLAFNYAELPSFAPSALHDPNDLDVEVPFEEPTPVTSTTNSHINDYSDKDHTGTLLTNLFHQNRRVAEERQERCM